MISNDLESSNHFETVSWNHTYLSFSHRCKTYPKEKSQFKKLSSGRLETCCKLWSSITPQRLLFKFASILHYSVFSIGNPKEIPHNRISFVNPIQIDRVGQKCQKWKKWNFKFSIEHHLKGKFLNAKSRRGSLDLVMILTYAKTEVHSGY